MMRTSQQPTSHSYKHAEEIIALPSCAWEYLFCLLGSEHPLCLIYLPQISVLLLDIFGSRKQQAAKMYAISIHVYL